MQPKSIYTDEELLKCMAENDDQAAFTDIYWRHWESLLTSAVKVIRSKEDAADIVQEIFLSLWKRRREVVLTGSLEAYLHTGIRYKTINFIQKHANEVKYIKAVNNLNKMICSNDAEEIMQTKKIEEVIQVVEMKMPPKMRAVYCKSRRENLTHKQIASEMGISEETVKKHIQHAMKLIKSALSEIAAFLIILSFLFRF